MPAQAGIVYLDANSITPPYTLDKIFDAIGETDIQLNGKPLGIVKFLEELCAQIEKEWETFAKPYLLRNMTATQYLYSRGMDMSPFEADINQKWEDHKETSPDAPWNKIGSLICCDVIREGGASLSRVAWGGRKELTPRLRLNLSINNQIYQLFAQRKEYSVEFKCYAHTSKESMLLKEVLNHWFQVRQEVPYSFGAQKFFVDSSNQGTTVDKRTSMYCRNIKLYLRLEDWYLGEPAPAISSVGIEWVSLNQVSMPTIGDSNVSENYEIP